MYLANHYEKPCKDAVSVEVKNFRELYDKYYKEPELFAHNFCHIKVTGHCVNFYPDTGRLDFYYFSVFRIQAEKCGCYFGLDLSEAQIDSYPEWAFNEDEKEYGRRANYIIFNSKDQQRDDTNKCVALKEKRKTRLAIADKVYEENGWLWYYENGNEKAVIQYVGNAKTAKVPKDIIHTSAFFLDSAYTLEEFCYPSQFVSKTVPNLWLENMYNLKRLVIEEGITLVGGGACRRCLNLEEVILPSTLTDIGEQSFANCTSLKSIYIPASVKVIDRTAFAHCINLEKVEFHPDCQITEIPDEMFMGCTSLKEIILPKSVNYIGSYAFKNCISLERVSGTKDEIMEVSVPALNAF